MAEENDPRKKDTALRMDPHRVQAQRFTFATKSGPNTVTLPYPMSDENYSVTLTQTGGALGSMPIVTDKKKEGFTITDAVSRTFEIHVQKDA